MKIALGTVQFGLDYGVSNQRGRVPVAEVGDILTLAAEHGVALLDTAAGYGSAEEVLGETLPPNHRFAVVTKTPVCADAANAKDAAERVERALHRSLDRLRAPSLYGLMVHHATDLLGPFGETIWAVMESARAAGLVAKLGVSAYSGEEVEALLERFPIRLIQLPFNLFDQRLVSGGQLARLKADGVEVHTRSAFLQGLLLMNPDEVEPALASAVPVLRRVRSEAERRGVSLLEAVLSAPCARPEIDAVVVGVTARRELEEILAAARRVESGAVDFPAAGFAVTDDTLLNPARWPELRRSVAARAS